MDATKISIENLKEAIVVSAEALPHFTNKSQNEIIRFVFCAIEKINKSLQGVAALYTGLAENPDLEFPIGILLRSLMMDNLMVQKIKHSIYTYVKDNPTGDKEGLLNIIKGLCYVFISDGTDNFIKDVKISDKLTDSEKEAIAKKFASQFPKAFDMSTGKPKLRPGFRVNIKDLYLESEHENLVSRESAYNLYTFYSKYDHLSHWTSLAKDIPFEQRKGKIDLAIAIVLMQLRDLLVFAYDADPDYTVLSPLFDRIQEHFLKEYDPEIGQGTTTS